MSQTRGRKPFPPHPDSKIEAQRQRHREEGRRHHIKHREEICAKSRQWRIDNPDKAKELDLKKKYGITLAQWQKMLEDQGGRCGNPGCRTTDPRGKYGTWHVDHDHITGKVRALLCADCNFVIGLVREDPFKLEGLAEYLRRHKS